MPGQSGLWNPILVGGCTFPNSPTYPIFFPFKELKSVVIPLPLRYTTPVNGSSSKDPIEVTGKPRALAAKVWIIALKPMSTLPDPMISVTSKQ
jgi:hypothetical protein